MIVFEMEQGTPAWHEVRAGKITASMFSEVRKTLKSGPRKGMHSQMADDYAFGLALERETGVPIQDEQFETYAMRRGRELEEQARLLHEARLGTLVQAVGFICDDDELFGASTDGLIDDDGMAEYKCFVAPAKLNRIIAGEDDSDVLDQIQGSLWLTGRQWCDFVLYVPQLASIGLDLITRRYERDATYIEELASDLLRFNELVEEKREIVQKLRGAPRPQSHRTSIAQGATS